MNSDVPVLHASSVTKLFGEEKNRVSVLRGVSVSLAQGETCALVGPSGSGKTTLLGLLAGLDLPTQGSISLLGYQTDQVPDSELRRLRRESVGFVFQSFHLLPALTALENVALPRQLLKHPGAYREAEHWLERVGLAHRTQHYPWQLSGGERQRVALARAFINQPQILFADEPTGNLDQRNAEEVWSLLLELNQQSQTTLILATHNLTLAQRCDRQFRLQDGQLIEGCL